MYIDAIKSAFEIRIGELDDAHSGELTDLLRLAFENATGDFEEKLAISEIVVTICQSIPEELTNRGVTDLLATGLYEKANALAGAGRKEDAIVTIDEAIGALSKSARPDGWLLPSALRLKGSLHVELQQYQEAILAFDEAVRLAQDSADVGSQRIMAVALHDKGRLLKNLGRVDEAIAVSDEVFKRFGGSEVSAVAAIVAWALVRKADLLEGTRKVDEATTTRDKILELFAGSTDPAAAAAAGWALHDKGVSLAALGRPDDAVAAFDGVEKQFRGHPLGLGPLAWSLSRKAMVLESLGRNDEAIAVWDDLVSRFGDSAEQSHQTQVARALRDKADLLQKLGQHGPAKAFFDEIVRRFEDSSDPELLGFAKSARERSASISKGPVDDGVRL